MSGHRQRTSGAAGCRRGVILPVVLLLAGALSMLSLAILATAAARTRAAGMHQAQVQGREWCLGARALPPGSELSLGAWRITRDGDGAISAAGPLGTYRLAADGGERWERRP